jgi:hypothetical protein
MARVVARHAAEVDAAPWSVPVREFAVSGYIAIVLASEAEMRGEWEAMRNCALEHIRACSIGKHVAISLRDRESEERVVTIILGREHGRYVALDARARFNRPCGPELWQVAQRAAAVYSGVSESPRVRRSTHCQRASRHGHVPATGMLTGSQAVLDFDA